MIAWSAANLDSIAFGIKWFLILAGVALVLKGIDR